MTQKYQIFVTLKPKSTSGQDDVLSEKKVHEFKATDIHEAVVMFRRYAEDTKLIIVMPDGE